MATPTTNLLPLIVLTALTAVLCLAVALWLPAPRRVVTPAEALAPTAVPLPTEYPEAYELPLLPPLTSPTAPPPAPASPTAVVPPRYVRHAQPAPVVPPGFVKLALVIDDMGVDAPATAAAMTTLPPTVTFAFLPYGATSPAQAHSAYAAGHEILVHLPMEPLPTSANGQTPPHPGPRSLWVADTSPTWVAATEANLAPFLDVAVGANNHMGSRFTQHPAGMQAVLATLASHGLLFVDSVTTARTATRAAATGLNLPLLRRDVFLDDVATYAAVNTQLDRAIAHAQRHGQAIAIGHPHPATLAVLAARLPTLASHSVVLVPVTALISND